jgi:hypothetical protein
VGTLSLTAPATLSLNTLTALNVTTLSVSGSAGNVNTLSASSAKTLVVGAANALTYVAVSNVIATPGGRVSCLTGCTNNGNTGGIVWPNDIPIGLGQGF